MQKLGYLGGEKLGRPILSPPDLWKHQPYLSWICKQSLLFRGWGKTGPAHSFPTLTSVGINLVQKLGYQGREKLGRPILSPIRLVKVSTLPVMNIQTTFAFWGVGKNWAGPFFPHPDKIKHQPCAGCYLGGEKLGWSVIFPPWQVKASALPCHEYTYNICFLGGGEKLGRPILSPPLLVVASILCRS